MDIADSDMISADMTSADVAAALGLAPHPEGGFFRETYRSASSVMTARGPRAASTTLLAEAGQGRHRGLIAAPQAVVPGGCWQAARLVLGDGAASGDGALPSDGVDWGLVSCVVSPGFIYDDFELAEREKLLAAYPDQAEVIAALT